MGKRQGWGMHEAIFNLPQKLAKASQAVFHKVLICRKMLLKPKSGAEGDASLIPASPLQSHKNTRATPGCT